MKKIVVLMSLLGLAACGNSRLKTSGPTPEQTCSVVDNAVVCPDGTNFTLPSQPLDGTPGVDGVDGINAVVYSEAKVGSGKCVKVDDGLYVENINNGLIFDVYKNDTCSDSLGEYCDNVEPSFGSTGQFGENKRGGAEVCWAGKTQVSGERLSNGDLLIRMLNFN